MRTTKSGNDEYATFKDALGRILRVSKAELNERIEADKRARAGQPKRGPKPKRSSVSGHASRDKG
jgi:hypothetical protein